MNSRLHELRLRRAELQARIASQREQVAEFGARWQGLFSVADMGMTGIRFMQRHVVLAGVLTAVLVARQRSLKGLLHVGWRLWRGYRLMRTLAGKTVGGNGS